MNSYKKTSKYHEAYGRKYRSGVVLLLTLVTLVVLSTIVYTLSSRIARFKHRQQYIIDYQNSKYACDSAMKYALATIEEITPKLIIREDNPDFSDLFTLNKEEYLQMLTDWAEEQALKQEQEGDSSLMEKLLGDKDSSAKEKETDYPESTDPNDPNDMTALIDNTGFVIDENDPNFEVPGPYGPKWPYVEEPIDIDVGQARVIIEIEDENAKMPLTWAITNNREVTKLADASLETFCEWMQMNFDEIDTLKYDLKELSKTKKYTLNAKPITITKKVPTTTASRRTSSRSSRYRRTTTSRRTSTRTVKQTRPAIAHAADFARLLHSSAIDLDTLARPIPDTGDRYESAYKYLGLWGSQRVNINSAPRHVLEAAFTFGGDAREIAHAIIQRRKVKPFASLKELQDELNEYHESIRQATPYITTKSTFFTVRVTAYSGNAKASSVATIIKNGKNVEKIAMISSRR